MIETIDPISLFREKLNKCLENVFCNLSEGNVSLPVKYVLVWLLLNRLVGWQLGNHSNFTGERQVLFCIHRNPRYYLWL